MTDLSMAMTHVTIRTNPMIKKCLFPVAGYGTRFLPATKAMPKEILPIVNKPLVQYGVEEAAEAGGRGLAAMFRVLLPVLVLFGGVLLMWYIGGQSSGADETVGPGAAALLLAMTGGSDSDEEDEGDGGVARMDRADARERLAGLASTILRGLRQVVVYAALTIVVIGPPAVIGWLTTPLLAVMLSGLFVAGAAAAVALVVALGLLASETIAVILWRVGLMPLAHPTLLWSPNGYELVDAAADDSPIDPQDVDDYYRIANHRVGVAYSLRDVDDQDWEAIERDQRLESVQLPNGPDSAVPEGYMPTEHFGNGPYGGFVPKRLKRSRRYLNAQILLGEGQGSAEGDKSIRRLTEAKDEFGGHRLGLSDMQLLLATLGAGLVSMAAGYFVFF
mgnify:CR=1 FL=1